MAKPRASWSRTNPHCHSNQPAAASLRRRKALLVILFCFLARFTVSMPSGGARKTEIRLKASQEKGSEGLDFLFLTPGDLQEEPNSV